MGTYYTSSDKHVRLTVYQEGVSVREMRKLKTLRGLQKHYKDHGLPIPTQEPKGSKDATTYRIGGLAWSSKNHPVILCNGTQMFRISKAHQWQKVHPISGSDSSSQGPPAVNNSTKKKPTKKSTKNNPNKNVPGGLKKRRQEFGEQSDEEYDWQDGTA